MKVSPDRTHLPSVTHCVLLTILVLAIAPYFLGLGASSLWDSNEAFYAETPREMIESGDFINPSFNYQPRFNKPPLCYWVVAIFYHLFGVSEAVERIPIAIGAMVMIATAYALGRLCYSSNTAGLLSAIVLATLPRFFFFSRRIIIDVYVAMFMSLALLFFALAEVAESPVLRKRRRLWLTLMYTSVGLGTMTKGPVAIFLLLMTVLIYFATNRSSLIAMRKMMLPAGASITAAIVLPWYLAVYDQHGWSQIESFIFGDNISRYIQTGWGPHRSSLFYARAILGDLFPWSIFLAFAIVATIIAGRKAQQNRAHGKTKLLLIWICVVVIFFTFSKNKEDLYILPIYPAAAALVGGMLAEGRSRRWLGWATLLVGVFISAGGAFILYLLSRAGENQQIAGVRAIGWLALIAGPLTAATAAKKWRFLTLIIIATAVVSAHWILALQTLPDFERYKPVRPLCELISTIASPHAKFGYYRYASPSMVFYLRSPIFEYYDANQLIEALSSNDEVYCLMLEADYEALKASLPVESYILASRPIFQVKLKRIITGAQYSQMVLISNKGRTDDSR
jgi:4-amino-4-deoxy-L-arabinose transferase-like glycosyltransferase